MINAGGALNLIRLVKILFDIIYSYLFVLFPTLCNIIATKNNTLTYL